MAIDTKPNLSSNKFEQCVGDSLTLSGNTNVHGTFIIQSGGTVSILSNKGQGKILVSDASGVGTWQINNSVSGATNGLTKIGQKIKLGGDLTGDTIINTANNDLSLCSSTYTNRGILLNQTSDELKFLWADTGNTCMSCAGFTPANISLLSQYAGGGCSAGISMVHADNRICFDSAGTVRTYHDTSGLWYTGDYSSSVSARWIPDAAWVTGQTGGITFLDLADTPNSYVGHSGKLLTVNDGASGITFSIVSIQRPEFIVNNETEFEFAYTEINTNYGGGTIRFGSSFGLSKNHSFSHEGITIECDYNQLFMNGYSITINGGSSCYYNNGFFDSVVAGSKFIFVAGYVSTTYTFYNCRFHKFLDSGSAVVFNSVAVTGSVHIFLKDSWISGTVDISAYIFLIQTSSSTAVTDITVTGLRSLLIFSQTRLIGFTGTKPPSGLSYIYDGTSTVSTSSLVPDTIYNIIDHNVLTNTALVASGTTYGHISGQAQTIYGPKTFDSELMISTSAIIISADTSNNLTFTDSVTGTKTLAELASGGSGGGGGIGWSNLANGSTIAGCGTVASGSTICRYTVYGVNALKNVTSGDNNIAIGYLALSANTTGIGNIGIGGSALYSNINGHYNIAQGMESLYNNISGQYNVGIGYVSLWCNTTGCDNVAVGQAALNGNVSGCYNVALGCSALLVNSSGNNNVGIGKRTLYNNDTGIMNIAIGDSSLFGNTTGSYNVAISECALYCNKTGLNNIAIGDFAMFYNTGGTCNIGIGLEALYSNISGNGNISIGVDNLNNSISGCDNIALGNLNANSIVSGSNNTFIGKYVGHNETGSYKLHIGSNSSSVNSKSLIYGEFDNEKLCIRGQTYMSGLTNSTKSNVIYYDISTNELSYGIVSGGTGGSLSEFTITGDSSSTGFTINHAKNKQFVGVEIIRNSSPYPTVYTSTYRTNANCVCITFDTAPANGLEYKILVSS